MPTFNTTDPKPGYVYDSALDTWFPLLGIAPGSSVVRWRKTVSGGETSVCLLYTSPSPRDRQKSRMPSSA